jgi:hypothetical protein
MSVEITPTTQATPTSQPQQPSLDLQAYPHGLGITAAGGTKSYFFPWRVIEGIHVEKKTSETGIPFWALTVQTAKDRINLTSARSLDADYRTICMNYKA